MKKVILLSAALAWCCLFAPLQAQQYRIREYRVEQGLPSDIIKEVTQDSLGFFWVSTDDGLTRFDGLRFITYKRAFRNQYTKGFLTNQDKELLAYADLDIIRIENDIDTVAFTSLLRGTRNPTDSTIWYPKALYEDTRGRLWISEPQAVSFYSGGKLTRFSFEATERSLSFIRSFSFFEAYGRLYTVSLSGSVFVFNEAKQAFERCEPRFSGEVNHAVFSDGAVLTATSEGIQKLEFSKGQPSEISLVLPYKNVSGLYFVNDTSLLASTFGSDLLMMDPRKIPEYELFPHQFYNINHVYISKDTDWWVSTNRGVVSIQRNIFYNPDPKHLGSFIESFAQHPQKDDMYFCTKTYLYALSPRQLGQSREVFHAKDGYFQSLATSGNRLWAASSFEVLLFEDEKLTRRFDFEREGKFIHNVLVDKDNTLWACQASNPYIIKIADDLTVSKIWVPITPESHVYMAQEGPDGIYVASNGIGNYLFFKPHGIDTFRNISVPINFTVQGDFTIHDMVVHNSTVWMATTEGLVKYGKGHCELVPLTDEYTRYSVRSIEQLDDNHLLFANSLGLFCYEISSGEFWVYDEKTGLTSNTITEEGIIIDKTGNPWIGTSNGLVYAPQALTSQVKTPRPYCLEITVNGQGQLVSPTIRIPYEGFVNASFSSISFPEGSVILQYRLRGKPDWHLIENNSLVLRDLPEGEHWLEVRAKNAGHQWSESTTLHLEVERPLWKNLGFIMSVALMALLIAWLSYVITVTLLSKRRKALEDLVNHRTQELKIANEELTQRNSELDRFVYSASHDLSAPLKSILGLIGVARLENQDPAQSQYLAMIESSVMKLEMFIKDVVNYSRNSRLGIKPEVIDFEELVKTILDHLQYLPNYKEIEFRIESTIKGRFVSDAIRIRIILNNLISNAIKFHWFTDRRMPYVRIKLEENLREYILSVTDNGKGIHAEQVDKIFEMFYRADEASNGSGLGLYILRETVNKLKGDIKVESTLSEGTRFIIYLPKSGYL